MMAELQRAIVSEVRESMLFLSCAQPSMPNHAGRSGRSWRALLLTKNVAAYRAAGLVRRSVSVRGSDRFFRRDGDPLMFIDSRRLATHLAVPITGTDQSWGCELAVRLRRVPRESVELLDEIHGFRYRDSRDLMASSMAPKFKGWGPPDFAARRAYRKWHID
jgi:hypothetical protein